MSTPGQDSPNSQSDAPIAERSGQQAAPEQLPCPKCQVTTAQPGTRWKGESYFGSGPILLAERLARTNPAHLVPGPTVTERFLRMTQSAAQQVLRGRTYKGPKTNHYVNVQRIALMSLFTSDKPETVLRASRLLQELDERVALANHERNKPGPKPANAPPEEPKKESADLDEARAKLKELGMD